MLLAGALSLAASAPVAMRVEPHGLGIDRHGTLVGTEVGQVAAVQADGHAGIPALGIFTLFIVARPLGILVTLFGRKSRPPEADSGPRNSDWA